MDVIVCGGSLLAERDFEPRVCDISSRIRGVVVNYLASQTRDPGIDSHQHLKDS